MPRITVTAECPAVITEEWTVDIGDDELAEVLEDKDMALDLLVNENVVNVENTKSDHEGDRHILAVEVVAPDYVTRETAAQLFIRKIARYRTDAEIEARGFPAGEDDQGVLDDLIREARRLA